jgi:DNA modification methylase
MMNLLQGNCLDILPTLEAESVQCCITSPPYFGLRDYGTATWEGGDVECDHTGVRQQYKDCKQGTSAGSSRYPVSRECRNCGAVRGDRQIGLEETPTEYVSKLVEVFREVRRVLKKDGLLWVNIGDSYAANRSYQVTDNKHVDVGNNGSSRVPPGLKPKDLMMIPARVAIALCDDGWYLRSEIVWHKPNPMPESVTDRCTKSHEMVYMLAKQERYYFDAEAIQEPSSYPEGAGNKRRQSIDGQRSGDNGNIINGLYKVGPREVRNKRSVWSVTSSPFCEAHFATFPPDLIRPMIMAGSRVGDTVLDPFAGSGTTGMVATELGRKSVLIELNPTYCEMAKDRCNVTMGML